MLKTYEYKGNKYEIVMIEKNGRQFLRDLKDGKPFTPFSNGIDLTACEAGRLKAMEGQPLLDVLIDYVEEGIRIWVENKDKI